MTITSYQLPAADVVYDSIEHIAQHGILGHHDPRVFDVGTEAFLRYFSGEILDDLLAQGGATCRFFEGSYGAGKTHLLRLLAAAAAERGMATVRTDLSQDLGLDDWRPITRTILSNIEVNFGRGTVRGFPDILDALRAEGRTNAEAFRAKRLPHSGFQSAMLRAVNTAPCPEPLRRYLLGERVSATDLKRVGITGIKDSLSSRNAEQVLATALGGLFHLGLAGTLVLFDENERTLVSTRPTYPKKLQSAANLIRRLIDGCTTGGLIGTAIVFAVLPSFLDNCALRYPALGQRLALPRGSGVVPSWRWPVLQLDAIVPAQEFEDFLDGAIERFRVLLTHCGADETNLSEFVEDAYRQGAAVLTEHVGQGYRRPLMKQLASLALKQLDEEGRE